MQIVRQDRRFAFSLGTLNGIICSSIDHSISEHDRDDLAQRRLDLSARIQNVCTDLISQVEHPLDLFKKPPQSYPKLYQSFHTRIDAVLGLGSEHRNERMVRVWVNSLFARLPDWFFAVFHQTVNVGCIVPEYLEESLRRSGDQQTNYLDVSGVLIQQKEPLGYFLGHENLVLNQKERAFGHEKRASILQRRRAAARETLIKALSQVVSPNTAETILNDSVFWYPLYPLLRAEPPIPNN